MEALPAGRGYEVLDTKASEVLGAKTDEAHKAPAHSYTRNRHE